MIKNKMKNEKGITMLTLVVTVALLAIITATLAGSVYDSTQVSKITKLENDIEALNDRVAVYYVEHEELPTLGEPFLKENVKEVIEGLSANDGDKYYTIDISKLDNLTLNYGEDYIAQTEDSYIINEESHIIYYVKGVFYQEEMYHTIGTHPQVILNH